MMKSRRKREAVSFRFLSILLLFPLFLFVVRTSLDAASCERESGPQGTSKIVDGEAAPFYPVDLTVESMTDPMGLDTCAPRLGWKGKQIADGFNLSQSAYQILVASSPEKLEENADLWDSGWVRGDESIQIPYAGKPLESGQRVWWKVRVKDADGRVSQWSDPGFWSMGILRPEDWKADWIGQPEELRGTIDLSGASWIAGSDPNQTVWNLRKEFTLDVTDADLAAKKFYAELKFAGSQQFQIFINGQQAIDSVGMVFNPELLRMVDVTDKLVSGRNVIAAKVWQGGEDNPVALLTKLTLQPIEPADDLTPGRGTPGEPVFSLASDDSWLVGNETGWEAKDFTPTDWKNATVLFGPHDGPWGKLRLFPEKTSPAFRKGFTLADKKIKEATLFISGLGFYEASIDGKKIEGRFLDPPMTRYDRRVLYSTYDLTDALRTGRDHSFRVLLGHGWWDLRTIGTWNFDASPWRDFPRLIAQINVVYEDGTRETIGSDSTWDCVKSPVVYDCIRQGEIIDGGYEEKTLGKAEIVPAPTGVLSASAFPGTTVVEELKPVTLSETDPGVWFADAGVNIAGWVRLRLKGLPKGQVVRIRYSERASGDRIDQDGIACFFTSGSPSYLVGKKGSFQTDYYIAGGKETEIFETRFAYHGFQFVEISGLTGELEPEDVTFRVACNGFPKIGEFTSSNELIDRIQEATLRSYRGNFVNGYPTDCPHREKNGWTGDAQLASEQAMYNWENTPTYEKWIRDLRDEQRPDGNLPGIVPTGGWGYVWGNGPAWDSSLVIIPWNLYLYRGDKRVLEESFDAMARYVDFMTSKADGDHLVSHGLGDWVTFKATTPEIVTSSGYYYLDTQIVAATARLLGKDVEAKKYADLAEAIRTGYLATLLTEDGVISNGTITAQSCPIHQGLTYFLPERERAKIFDQLLESLKKADYHFDCGILGSKYILRTLSENGRTDLALRMVLQETRPCFADWIRRGGGTLWEDWEDGSSRNHIMFGDVSAWFYQYLAGIKLEGAPYSTVATDSVGRPGFKKFEISPQCRRSDITVPDRAPLTFVSGRTDSPYGEIASAWEWNADQTEMSMTVKIPVNTIATVNVPFEEGETVTLAEPASDAILMEETLTINGKKAESFYLGSGEYHFTVKKGE